MGINIEGTERYRKLNPVWWAVSFVFSTLALLLAVLHIFTLKPFGFMLIETSYFYTLIGLCLPQVFIIFPASKNISRNKIPWYDYILFFLCFGISVYFASVGFKIIEKGWELIAPPFPTLLSVGLWFIVLEGVRRTSGLILTVVCGLFSLFPLFAEYLPGFLWGPKFSFLVTARYHAMSTVSMLGIPMQVVGNLLVGFILFGLALQATGGGQFFLDFAMASMGKRRGGAAKVSVISSALFGTMSGSVISNVLVDGPFTIPAMKKTGYPAHYAAAIEAVSSTGGALMPPIMGTSAFVMASFLNIPYATVAICAAIPAILYYLGLFFQIDCYAGKVGLKGLPKTDIPSFRLTIKRGWLYVIALVVLVILVFYVRTEAEAPFYTMVILFLCAMLKKETRLSGREFLDFVVHCGRLLAEVTAILVGIGLVIGSMSMTGVAFAFSYEFISLTEGNVYLLLLLCAFTSSILGMGMTAVACYIFLAITIAPALISLGLEPLAVHIFVLYWGLISFITPPVALAAIAAAPIAGANPMATGYAAMRLGSVMYFVPFFFVLNPALILIGSLENIIISFITAVVGVYFISSGMEGYMAVIGRLSPPVRLLIGLGGMMLFIPWRISELVGVIIIILTIIYQRLEKKSKTS